ncbi:MAG: hypothetical protein P8Y68_05790 [Anaerolineales bacterium]
MSVSELVTGKLTGKGKNLTFTLTTLFAAGDSVIFQAKVVDTSTGLPIPNATVDITIIGPETVTLISGLSDSAGIAEATWRTSAPNKRGQGGTTPGDYTATVSNVTVSGYNWDGVTAWNAFTIQ